MSNRSGRQFLGGLVLSSLVLSLEVVVAQCPASGLQNATAGGAVACPCFVKGERAGVVFEAPVDDYPIEILKVGIAWSSAFGGAPQSLEQAIRIYPAGLPDPGAPVFSLDAPVMTDGFMNEFDLEPLPGEIVVGEGKFTVALEFLNTNAGDSFKPSVAHDGNGCVAGRNAVFAIPGGWFDACVLGVTGDWAFTVTYRPVECPSAEPRFIRGNVNADARYDISDAIFLLNHLFSGSSIGCQRAADANNDGGLDISDPLYILNNLFGGGPLPEAPHPGCGDDPGNSEPLGCDDFPAC